jgi:D-sedoheptulose 7-phosphate isomerase
MLEQRIQQQFFDSADLQYQSAESLTRPIADAVQALVACITAGGKLMVCGTGGGAALAEVFVAAFVGRFERERPGLAALTLPAPPTLAGVTGAEQVLARQVQALGMPGDLLLLVDAAADAAALVAAAQAARDKDMTVLALTGRGGGALGAALDETDVLIAVPHERAARVLETQLLVLHCLCDAVDLQLMGEQDPS